MYYSNAPQCGKFRFRLSGLSSQAVKTYNQKETRAAVILSERSESKDLGTNLTANINEMRRSFDSAGAPLRMTTAFLVVMLYRLSKPDSLNYDLLVRHDPTLQKRLTF